MIVKRHILITMIVVRKVHLEWDIINIIALFKTVIKHKLFRNNEYLNHALLSYPKHPTAFCNVKLHK